MTSPNGLPSARDAIDQAERDSLPYASRETGYRRMAQNHLRAAETAGSTDTASAARRATWHLDQARALADEADASHIDYRQVVQPQGPGEPPENESPVRDRSDARRAADEAVTRLVREGHMADAGAQTVTGLLERGHKGERDVAAMWAATTGDPAYTRAFAKYCTDPTMVGASLTADEQCAYQRVVECRGWLEGTPASAGWLVPLSLDPVVQLSSAGSLSPLRSVARVESISTDRWRGVSSAGITVREGEKVGPRMMPYKPFPRDAVSPPAAESEF